VRPLLLLDVDGVLNPFTRPGREWISTKCTADGRTYRLLLNPAHGPQLLKVAQETGCELVWATTWEHDANTQIAPKVGLPELPVIEVDRNNTNWPVNPHADVLFKTPHVAAYVNRRPFVWLDDDLTEADEEYLREHDNVGDFLIIHVRPASGLTSAHLEQAAAWLSGYRHGGEAK